MSAGEEPDEPDVGERRRRRWLRRRDGAALLRGLSDEDARHAGSGLRSEQILADAPTQFATEVSGGEIEKLVNIGEAGIVVISEGLAPVTALYQLPPDIRGFAGRVSELKFLTEVLERGAGPERRAAAVVALAGMAGVGKSALAVHVAHLLKDRFPDAQLYADLRGTDGRPLASVEVLAGFLRALGVRDSVIPDDRVGRIGLYRARLSVTHALLVLDNCLDESQVRDLVPACPSCAVLLTSRRRLDGLDGATVIELAVPAEAEGLELLRELVGAERVDAERQTAGEIVRLCGCLPLALRVAGGKLRSRREWTLADYATQLADEGRRLERLALADQAVRSSFALSYQDLEPAEARLFRLLGLLVRTDFGVDAAAALAAVDRETAADVLEHLVDVQLVELAGRGRYRLHDLTCLFARERLRDEEPLPARDAAELRLAESYLRVAEAAAGRLGSESRRPERAVRSGRPSTVEQGLLESLEWLERERTAFIEAIGIFCRARAWAQARQLAASLREFFRMRAHHEDWYRAEQLLLEAARRTGDAETEAVALYGLGSALAARGSWEDAIESYELALAIYRTLGDREGEARTFKDIGNTYHDANKWIEAIEASQRALAIYRETGDLRGQAWLLNNLGTSYDKQARWPEAVTAYAQARAIFDQLGNRDGVGGAILNLGVVYASQRRFLEASGCFEQALDVAIEIGDREREALAINWIGQAFTGQGRWPEAIKSYERALGIHRELGNRLGEAKNLVDLGSVRESQDRFEEAIDCYERARAIYTELAMPRGEAVVLQAIAFTYLVQGRAEEARQCYERALSNYRDVGDRQGEAGANQDLAIFFWNQGRFGEAIESAQVALSLYRQIGRPQSAARLFAFLGRVYMHDGRFQEAIDAAEEALNLSRQLGDRHSEAVSRERLGLIYSQQGRSDEAIASLGDASTIYGELGDRTKQVEALEALGDLYASDKRWVEANECREEAEALRSRPSHATDEAAGHTTLTKERP